MAHHPRRTRFTLLTTCGIQLKVKQDAEVLSYTTVSSFVGAMEDHNPDPPPPSPSLLELEEKFRFVIGWSFVILALLLAITGLAWWLIADWNAPYLIKKLDDQFDVLIGIPASAAAALLLVIFLRTTDGPIEFEALGFKFKGASGPIVLWVFVFLSIVAAIKVLTK